MNGFSFHLNEHLKPMNTPLDVRKDYVKFIVKNDAGIGYRHYYDPNYNEPQHYNINKTNYKVKLLPHMTTYYQKYPE